MFIVDIKGLIIQQRTLTLFDTITLMKKVLMLNYIAVMLVII